MTPFFTEGWGSNGAGPGLRLENVNLHTTFPRRYRLPLPRPLGPLVVLLIPVLLLGALCLSFYLLPSRHNLISSFVFGDVRVSPARMVGVSGAAVAAVAVVVAVGSMVALPESGSLVQRGYQVISANSWAYDGVQAMKSRPWSMLLWLAGLQVVPPVVGAKVDRTRPWWLAQLAAAAALAALVMALGAWADRVAREMGPRRRASLPQQVKGLTIVPALSWTSMSSYPGERYTRQRPLLFVSTYNEGGGSYVGAFVESMGDGLQGPWGRAPGFPSTRSGFRQFVEFVGRTAHPIDHSYIACPTYTVADIRNALQLEREYRSMKAALGGAAPTAVQYHRFLVRSRLALSSVPQPPSFAAPARWVERRVPRRDRVELWAADCSMPANSSVTSSILISVLPLGSDADEVASAIRQLPGGSPESADIEAYRTSPFNRVLGTRIARLMVVAPWRDPAGDARRCQIHIEEGDHDGFSQPHHAWLMLAAQFDTPGSPAGGVGTWLDRLHEAMTPAGARAIWGPAAEFRHRRRRRLSRLRRGRRLDPGNVDDFRTLVLAGRHHPRVQVIDHEQNTLWDVVRALDTHRLVSAFVVGHPQPSPDDLRHFSELPLLPRCQVVVP